VKLQAGVELSLLTLGLDLQFVLAGLLFFEVVFGIFDDYANIDVLKSLYKRLLEAGPPLSLLDDVQGVRLILRVFVDHG